MSNLDKKIDVAEEPVAELESLQFFQTQPHKCSYLAQQTAATVFLNPKQTIDKALYSQLSEFGFRRSGRHIYKPMCNSCQACVPMRIPVELFTPNRQQKRTMKRNQDLSVRVVRNIDTDEHYGLYERYISQRHADGDMYPPSREQFRSFLTDEWQSTRYYEFRLGDELVATSVADMMDNGISAVYTYYAPEQQKRSLGSFVILYLIKEAQKLHLPALYMGYWIQSSTKMQYKSAYRPFEIMSDDRWLLIP